MAHARIRSALQKKLAQVWRGSQKKDYRVFSPLLSRKESTISAGKGEGEVQIIMHLLLSAQVITQVPSAKGWMTGAVLSFPHVSLEYLSAFNHQIESRRILVARISQIHFGWGSPGRHWVWESVAGLKDLRESCSISLFAMMRVELTGLLAEPPVWGHF